MNIIKAIKDRRAKVEEERREASSKDRLEAWKQMQFVEDMTEALEKFQSRFPDAKLEFTGDRTASIVATHPATGQELRWQFIP